MTRFQLLLGIGAGLLAASTLRAAEVPVRVEAAPVAGPRTLEQQSKEAVIRDYLRAWESFRGALEHNRPELLAADFVGTARDTLANTVQQQAQLGMHTRYQDLSHDLQILFYSPDGLSIELADKVDYEVQVVDHDKVITTQRESSRYLVVLTPAEVRWKVRIFQSVPE